MNWLNHLFTDAEGVTPWWGIALAVLIVLAIGAAITGIIILIVNAVRKKSEGRELTRAQWTTRELMLGALCIAIAFALSYLKFFEMPFGGSITPASMLPIMLFAYIYGTPKGLIVGLAYGLLQMLQGIFITPLESPILQITQIIMDYGIAFMALALAGLFKRSFLLGIIAGGLARLVVATVSGMLFFAMYAEGESVFVYSFIYNLTYLGPDLAICFVIALIPGIRKAVEAFKAQAGKKALKAQA
jgi:Predicted membrane protein